MKSSNIGTFKMARDIGEHQLHFMAAPFRLWPQDGNQFPRRSPGRPSRAEEVVENLVGGGSHRAGSGRHSASDGDGCGSGGERRPDAQARSARFHRTKRKGDAPGPEAGLQACSLSPRGGASRRFDEEGRDRGHGEKGRNSGLRRRGEKRVRRRRFSLARGVTAARNSSCRSWVSPPTRTPVSPSSSSSMRARGVQARGGGLSRRRFGGESAGRRCATCVCLRKEPGYCRWRIRALGFALGLIRRTEIER